MTNLCVFCLIVNRLKPAEILFEDETFLAFLDHRPVTFGHTLVIPKAHYPTLLDVPKPILGGYLETIQRVAENLISCVKAEGFNLHQNNFAAAGQVVFHIHFHILPRFSTDGVAYRRHSRPYLAGEAETLSLLMRQSLSQNLD